MLTNHHSFGDDDVDVQRGMAKQLICCSVAATNGHKSFKTQASFSSYPLASKVMVRNLPYSTDESCLEKIFSSFGHVAEVKIVKDEVTKRSKGYAFIQYTSQENAMLALDSMDHKYLNGRVISVELAKPTKKDFGTYPKSCGPPVERLPSENEVPDLQENC